VGTGVGIADATTGGSVDDGSGVVGVAGATDVVTVGDGATLAGAHAAKSTTRPSANDLMCRNATPACAAWESELAGPKY